MKNPHKKVINGQIYITICKPLTYSVDAWDETYEDENGNQYTEEEYEIGVDDVLKYGEQTEEIKEINDFIVGLKEKGWKCEEISIE